MPRCEKCGSAATVEIVFSTSGGLVAVPKVQRKKIVSEIFLYDGPGMYGLRRGV